MAAIPDRPSTSASSPPELLRVLGVAFGVAVAVGSIIGAGILRSPAEIAARLPMPALFLGVWVVGGVYALLGANSLAELGTMLPRSGSQYVYARHALGPYAGFVVGWNDWVSTCGSVAAISIVIGESVSAIARPLASHAAAIAAVVVLIVTVPLWRGARSSDRTQQVTSLVKALAFLALVVACFASGRAAPDAGAPLAMPHGVALLAAFVVALQGVIFAYDGWTGVLYFSEEVRDPGRQIPRAIFGGVLAVIAIYLLINAAFLYVLPMRTMATSTLVAASAATRVFGAAGDGIIRALVIVALPSAVSANLLMASRVGVAMARDGLFPRTAARVSATGSPTVSLLASTACALLFVLTGTYETVIAILAFFFVATYAISFASVFVLRRREPAAPRPWRAWGYPWTTGIVLLGSIAFLVSAVATDTRNSGIALALVVVSYPVFRLVQRTTAH